MLIVKKWPNKLYFNFKSLFVNILQRLSDLVVDFEHMFVCLECLVRLIAFNNMKHMSSALQHPSSLISLRQLSLTSASPPF